MIATALVAFSQIGCFATNKLPKMQDDGPVAINRGLFAVRYKQEGRAIDASDMRDRLAERPASASDAKRAKALQVVGMIFAAVGGGLIGWPIGQKIGGEAHPIWPLAYAGAGAVAVSIPLGIWADASLDSAVETHNKQAASPVETGPESR